LGAVAFGEILDGDGHDEIVGSFNADRISDVYSLSQSQ
jgi:hypothetical protein